MSLVHLPLGDTFLRLSTGLSNVVSLVTGVFMTHFFLETRAECSS